MQLLKVVMVFAAVAFVPSEGHLEGAENRDDATGLASEVARILRGGKATAVATYGTSSTTYYGGDSAGSPLSPPGACGGARVDKVRSSLAAIRSFLPFDYFPVAVSQQMMEPLTCNVGKSVGAGYANVLHVHCGQCVEFTTKKGVTVGGLVLDICPPGSANTAWCQTGGKVNSAGKYNHLDFFGSSRTDVPSKIGDNPTGTVKLVTCPDKLDTMMTTLANAKNSQKGAVCNWYYDGSVWQGAYGMHKWGCNICVN
jgi:hypothetical protein